MDRFLTHHWRISGLKGLLWPGQVDATATTENAPDTKGGERERERERERRHHPSRNEKSDGGEEREPILSIK